LAAIDPCALFLAFDQQTRNRSDWKLSNAFDALAMAALALMNEPDSDQFSDLSMFAWPALT
jgi:hypothetical protein